MAEYYSIVYVYHTFIHSSVRRHLGCFHILATVIRTAVNTGVPTTSACVPSVSHSHSPPPQEALEDLDRYGWDAYEITAFALGPGVCDILCASFKSKVSISLLSVEIL